MFTYLLVGAVITIFVVGIARSGKMPQHMPKSPIEDKQGVILCEDPSVSHVGYLITQDIRDAQINAQVKNNDFQDTNNSTT